MRSSVFILLAFVCGSAHAEDADAICKASMDAYRVATASGDAAKLAAVYAPGGELVGPYGIVQARDALIKMFASYMKAGDKDEDTLTSARMIGDVRFAPAATPTRRRRRARRMRKAFGRRSLARSAASGRSSI